MYNKVSIVKPSLRKAQSYSELIISVKHACSQAFLKLQRLQPAFYVTAMRLSIVVTLVLSLLEEMRDGCLTRFEIVDRRSIVFCSSEADVHFGNKSCDVCEYETCDDKSWDYSSENNHLANDCIKRFLSKACACNYCFVCRQLVNLLTGGTKSKPYSSWQTRIKNVLLRARFDYKFAQLVRIIIVTIKRKWLFIVLGDSCVVKSLMLLTRALSIDSTAKAYKRLVVDSSNWLINWILKIYFRRLSSKANIVEAGKTGLLVSVNRFDFGSGYKFSTYAKWWVKQKMGIALTLALPVQQKRISVSKVRSANAELFGLNAISVVKVERLKLISFDRAGENYDLHSVIASDNSDVVDRRRGAVRIFSMLQRLVFLTPKEERILRLRGHASFNRSWSLAKIGREMGLSRERIRQIEASAGAKVRTVCNDAIETCYS
ncbi:sigma factor-like helix-turn-helix DNA-binding protein [Candidatus Hodgkinia cicadicola]